MGIIKRYIIVVLLGILVIPCSFSQGEGKIVDSLTGMFSRYVEKIPWEEIYVHTDRENYMAGENIWMKLFLIDRRSMRPSETSKIAYVELLNSGNRPVVQAKYAIDKGFGFGQIQLPDTLSTGIYTLRTYTSWMKNFLPCNCFIKETKIFNINKTGPKPDHAGRSINQSGCINGKAWKPDSCTMLTARRLSNGNLEINIRTDTGLCRKNRERLFIFIQTHGIIDHVAPVILSDSDSKLAIPAGKLTPGINQITLINSNFNPVAEKYIYTPPSDTISPEITLNGIMHTREKITLDIKTPAIPASVPAQGSLSIAVVPFSETGNSKSIGDFLVAGTEFGWPQPDINLRTTIATDAIIDSVLDNIKSNWIDWNAILSDNRPELLFRAEKEAHFLTCRLENDNMEPPKHPVTVLLSIPGREPELQISENDNLGKFTFSIPVDEEVRDLVIIPDDPDRKIKIIPESPFSDRYPLQGRYEVLSKDSMPGIIEEMSINHQIRRIYGIRDAGEPYPPLFLPPRNVRFYGKPDIELILADYVALPKMEEVFFELLPKVSLRKKGDSFEILIADRINDKRYELSPFLFLDGVKIRDASIIAGIDPEEVEKIEVVKEKYIIGNYIFPGILNVVTKKADFTIVPLPDYMTRIQYRVVDPSRSFLMPDYSSAERRGSSLPDFRNTLYWNPSVVTDKEGTAKVEFWTSDLPGKYKVIIQGISTLGQVINTEMTFTVE
jgi:hypothetical protein